MEFKNLNGLWNVDKNPNKAKILISDLTSQHKIKTVYFLLCSALIMQFKIQILWIVSYFMHCFKSLLLCFRSRVDLRRSVSERAVLSTIQLWQCRPEVLWNGPKHRAGTTNSDYCSKAYDMFLWLKYLQRATVCFFSHSWETLKWMITAELQRFYGSCRAFSLWHLSDTFCCAFNYFLTNF